MASPISGRRRTAGLAGFAGLVLTVALALAGCDPSAADTTPTSSPSVAATPSAAAPTSAAPASPTVPAPPVVTPSAPPVATAPPPSAPPAAHPQTPSAKPQPKVTTAQPPNDPQSQHTQAAGGTECEIRSNAGNCYAAGQFCRNDDLGRSTHDANGRMIYCRMVSGKPHWQA
ncbi:hypothetical protein ACIQWA_08855 [Kitasatospora sp. NPDC098652]|uniref:hypothetical protein n=1 Tax=Kitasatospora sp. NPDC098652 TaxID=3364095 RepID=UPI0038063024